MDLLTDGRTLVQNNKDVPRNQVAKAVGGRGLSIVAFSVFNQNCFKDILSHQ